MSRQSIDDSPFSISDILEEYKAKKRSDLLVVGVILGIIALFAVLPYVFGGLANVVRSYKDLRYALRE